MGTIVAADPASSRHRQRIAMSAMIGEPQGVIVRLRSRLAVTFGAVPTSDRATAL